MRKIIFALSVVSLVFVILTSGLYSAFFSGSVVENLHRKFIRMKARDVVKLVNPLRGGGTGFYTKTKSGRVVILTNNHICKIKDEAGTLIAKTNSGDSVVKVIKSYSTNDLCIIEAPQGVTAGLGVANSVKIGELVYATGHPFLEDLTVTQGEISGKTIVTIVDSMNVEEKDCIGESYKFEIVDNMLLRAMGMINVCERVFLSNSGTINILPGNSGSPVLNMWGNVVGVVFASNESGVHSYIVPLDDVKKFLGDN